MKSKVIEYEDGTFEIWDREGHWMRCDINFIEMMSREIARDELRKIARLQNNWFTVAHDN